MNVRLAGMAEGSVAQRRGPGQKRWWDRFGYRTMQIIGSGVEDNGAGPDGFELLNDQRVSQKPLGLGANGDFEARDPGHAHGPLVPRCGRG